MVLFCHTDVTGRTETDPTAEALVRIFSRTLRVEAGTPPQSRVCGEARGKKLSKRQEISVTSSMAEAISSDECSSSVWRWTLTPEDAPRTC